jgi:hypothetical protein
MENELILSQLQPIMHTITEVSKELNIALVSQGLMLHAEFNPESTFSSCDVVLRSDQASYVIVAHNWFDEATRTRRKNWKKMNLPSLSITDDELAEFKAQLKAAVLEVQNPDYANPYWPDHLSPAT